LWCPVTARSAERIAAKPRSRIFSQLAEKSFTTTPSRFLADEDVVVVLGEVTAGGESAPEADVSTFRGGKIVQLQAFSDTAMFERVYGRK
jgi:ketosteroid isomerase-like protein